MYTAKDIIERRRKLWEERQDPEQDKELVLATAEFMISDQGAGLREEIQQNPEYLVEMCFVIVIRTENRTIFPDTMYSRTFITIKQAIEIIRQAKD